MADNLSLIAILTRTPNKNFKVIPMRKYPRCTLLTVLLLLITNLICQEVKPAIPPQVQSEIKSRGLTSQEAIQQAAKLGIDLTNPTQAAAQARRLGIPESQIQEMLRQASQTKTQSEADVLEPLEVEEVNKVELAEKDNLEIVVPDLADDTDGGKLEYFGYRLFSSIPGNFEQSTTGPVEDSYRIGFGDELRLIVWGAAEFQYDLRVDREGRIYVPQVGLTTVVGKRLDDLRRDLLRWLSRAYNGLTTQPPLVFMDLTVTRLRPIRIFILGEVKRPGGYTVANSSSIFNALYMMGGPTTSGSLRQIHLIRDEKIIASVDLYDYLLEGYSKEEIRLIENDHLFIPLRGKTVSVTGAVKRPAIYELKKGEGFSQLLSYVGGLEAEAYTKRFQIERIIPPKQRTDPSIAREVIDVDMEKVLAGESNISLYDGDVIRILSILDIIENVVTIEGGPVLQPGQYELGDSIRTVRDLILAADGVTLDVYMPKVDLIRINPDLTEKLISLNLTDVFDDIPSQNLPLIPSDRLRIYSIHDLEIPSTVRISGKIRKPGNYAFRESMTVYDLLFLGGGLLDEDFLKDVLLERADLYRRKSNSADEIIIPFHLSDALNGRDLADNLLHPGDEIRVYPADVSKISEKLVRIDGEVKQPGQYTLRENMTLEDLILQAMGFTEGAYLADVTVNRLIENDFKHPQNYDADTRISISLTIPLSSSKIDSISYAIADTLNSLDYARDFLLQHEDIVRVRINPDYQIQEEVTIFGEVFFPGKYGLLEENETLGDLIRRAGGITGRAYPKGGQLLRNGQRVITQIDDAINGKANADVILSAGDIITVPRIPNAVHISGNVNLEGLVKYRKGKKVDYYLKQVGDVMAETDQILLTQANGATWLLQTRLFFFRENPTVDDGATIVVTRKTKEPGDEGIDLKQILAESLATLTSVLTLLILVQRL